MICVIKMSALELLQIYRSEEDSSGEDFTGFGESVSEQFPSPCWQSKAAETDLFSRHPELFIEPDPAPKEQQEVNSETTETPDSDGSFYRGVKRKRKRTKKEWQKMKVARSKRLSHNAILTSCGCAKECNAVVSKDDRVLIHARFWNLGTDDQKSFIRENVTRTTVQRRRMNHAVDDPRKSYTYIFHARFESGEMRQVCKKFFLNTLGYNENCG